MDTSFEINGAEERKLISISRNYLKLRMNCGLSANTQLID
jgi:hypothetical protein